MNKSLAAIVPVVVAIVLIVIIFKVIGALLGLAVKLVLVGVVAGGAFLAYKAVKGRIGGPREP